MKSQKVQILLSVLVFASLCGAPAGPKATHGRHKIRIEAAADRAIPVDGVMSNARNLKPKAGESHFKREYARKNVAAAKIQRAARARQGRARGASNASSASIRSRSSSRSTSPVKAAPAMPVVDPTESMVG